MQTVLRIVFISLPIATSLLFSSCSNQSKTDQNQVETKLDSVAELASRYPDSIPLQLQWHEQNIQGQNAKIAVEALNTLYKLHPERTDILNMLSKGYLQSTDSIGAIMTMQKSLALDINQPDLEADLCYLFAVRGDLMALPIADRLIKTAKDNIHIARAQYLKGIFYSNVGFDDRALAAFDSSIISNFTFIDAYIEKSVILFEQKRYKEAIALLNKASELDKFNAEIYFLLAKNHDANANKKEAIFFYEQTLVLDTSYPTAKKALNRLKNNKEENLTIQP
jgi:tetratricopeptide (TPR) repeat protein